MATDLREFVAEDLWLLLGIVTFALISIVGVIGLEAVAGLIAIVGWFLLVPVFLFWGEEIAALLFEEPTAESLTSAGPDRDAVEELKRRYTAGEIDNEEFERRLERLVGVEDALEEVFSDRASNEASPSTRSSESTLREPEQE
ncbi:SHOCT domain-containing protein [Natronococcus roseus]|uniref:SHOCT domain-containing protein n=1 Tax=Natronococcus roseus TaxID=1052014 RepID=UPI00374D7706